MPAIDADKVEFPGAAAEITRDDGDPLGEQVAFCKALRGDTGSRLAAGFGDGAWFSNAARAAGATNGPWSRHARSICARTGGGPAGFLAS